MIASDLAKKFEGKKIVVTGAQGYIGSNLCQALSQFSCEVVRVGRSKPGPGPQGIAHFNDKVFDVTHDENWAEILSGADFVFHFSAQTSVPVANQDPVADLQANVFSTYRLLETCRNLAKRPFVLLAGSVTEIGMSKSLPVDEDHPVAPVTVYCLHKLFIEEALELYCRQNWADGATLRLANVYGPGPKSSSSDRGVLNQMILKALKGQSLSLFGSGEQIRDYIFIDDVVSAFLSAAAYADHTRGHHYVLASGTGTTLKEAFTLVASRVAEKTGQRVEVQQVSPPAGSSVVDQRNFIGDTRRLRADAHWTPASTLVEGIDKTIEFYRSQKG